MKNLSFFLLQLCVYMVLSGNSAQSQSMNKLAAGINANGAFNFHRGLLTTNEGVLECGNFENATTFGWTIGNYANIPLSDNFSLSPRLYYHKANGKFTAPNPVNPLITLNDGSTVKLTTDHTLNVSLDYISLDALGQYFLTEQIYGNFGITTALSARNAFEQEEQIISPKGALFLDGSSTRRIAAGYFTDASGTPASSNIRIGAVLGAGMMIPIGTSFIINPEVSFQYGITNILATTDWKVHSLRFGVGLMYVLETSPSRLPEIEEKSIEAPIIATVAPPITMFDANNVNADGSVENYAEITINEHRSLDILPLLPYIFFEPESSEILQRYKLLTINSANNFSESNLPNNQIEVYHDVLNIIGARMRQFPNAKLTLTGCIEPMDDGKDKSLGSNRASVVRNYLHDIWGVSDDRMSVQSRELPEIRSNRTNEEGRAENRRVEISSNNDRILAPIYVKNGNRTVHPTAILLTPTVTSGSKIETSEYSIYSHKGQAVWSRQTNGIEAIKVPTNEIKIDDYSGKQPLSVMVKVTSEEGKTAVATRPIPIRKTFSSTRGNAQIVKDTLIERYSMILFNFDRATTIAGKNDQVSNLIRSRIRTTSSVNIEGMTDYLGQKESNQRLSEARAAAVQSSITEFIKPASIETKGVGQVSLFDNVLPEGRFYNRRVLVEIATPLNPELDGELR